MCAPGVFCLIFGDREGRELVKMNDKEPCLSFSTNYAKVFLAFLQEGAYNMS